LGGLSGFEREGRGKLFIGCWCWGFMKIVVVDEEDDVVGAEERSVVDEMGLRYRVSGLWVRNSGGDVLLARRAFTKSHYPGRWGPAVSGTVDEGESYEDNIVKEAEEEIGLSGVDFEKGPKVKMSGKYNHFTQWFVAVVDEPVDFFKIQEEEVVEVRWFSVGEFKLLGSLRIWLGIILIWLLRVCWRWVGVWLNRGRFL